MPVDDQEPRYRLAIQDVDGNIVDRLGTLYAEPDGTLKIQEGSGSFNEASLNPDGTFSVPTAPVDNDDVARKQEIDGKADTPHDLGGADHSEDTLENLNSKVSDADLATDPHGNENHDPNFAEDPHGNAAHSEDFITGVDTADNGAELGEAIRYVFGNALSVNDLGDGEIEINGSEGGVETIDPNTAVDGEAPTADDSSGTNPLAIGVAGNTLANDDNAVAIGNAAEASDISSVALGVDATASGITSVALGRETTASDTGSVALGQTATASDTNSLALGRDTTASSSSSTALGRGAEALDRDSGTIGVDSDSIGPSDWTVPGDFTVNGSKDFEIDHPSKPDTHDLRHGAFEGPVPGGLIYSKTVEVDGTKTSLDGVLPDYITNNDFGRAWTDHVNENEGFGTGYIDTETWTLHVEHSGEYDVTLIGERDDDAALSKGKHRTEKPKGETWNGNPRTYWVDVGRVDTDDYDGVARVEAKYDHTLECSSTPCKEAFESYRVTFDDGERIIVKGIEYDSTAQEIIDAARE